MSTAIHDIGYRHYEGRRLGRAYVVRSLFVHNLRAVYGLGRPARAKVMPFALAAMMTLPAVGSVAVLAITKQPETLIVYSKYPVIMQLLVAIFLATQAPVVASRELRFRVVPLYFSRPVGPLDFTLAKVGAFVTALFLLLALPVTLLYLGVLTTRADKMKPLTGPDGETPPPVPSLVEHTLNYLGALAGCVLFALVLGALALVIAAFTPRRGFGVAAVIATYLVSSTMVLIAQGVAEELTNFTLAGWAGLFAPFTLVDTVQVRLLGAEKAAFAVPPDPWGGPAAAALCAVLVAGSTAVLYARFRKAGLS